jgi:3-hydroxyacyl-CoA dehydrogenase / 3-hydroxy-2-methylbutyryl-CoA dehydrogenase
MNVQHAIAVVAGGASGLGLATVHALLARGAKVAIFDLDAQAPSIRDLQSRENVLFQQVNLVDAPSIQSGIAETLNAFGGIHVLVNCAGVVSAEKTLDKQGKAPSLDALTRTLHVNLIGAFSLASLVAQAMANNAPDDDGQRGVIINTASVAAWDGQTGQTAYAASKAGLVGMTLPMARDLSRYGIRVMTIAPGIFDTPMMHHIAEEYRQPLVEMVQNPKRFGKPSEYAHLCVSIVENNYLNAETIRLDGGIRMQPK